LCNPGRLISKDELLREVWRDAVVTEDSLVQCVKEIRQALGQEWRETIRTVPRQGYAFVGLARREASGSDAATPSTVPGRIWLFRSSEEASHPTATAANVTLAAGVVQPAWRWHRKGWLWAALVVAALGTGGLAWHWLPHSTVGTGAAQLSIVVLPFATLDDEAGQGHFAMGLTDDLTTDLSRIPHSLVIAHGTAQIYDNRPRDVRQIGRELGVRYLLDGSVRRVGDQIRLNVSLVDAQSGQQLWAERFDGDRHDLVALERHVTLGLVRRLQLQMLSADTDKGLRQNARNPDAYDLALRGWALILRKQPDAIAQARDAAEKALALDPRSAFAWAVLSRTYFMDIAARWMQLRGHSREEWLKLAEETADKAFTIDPEMFEAIGARASVLTLRGRFDEALALRAKQIVLYPSDPEPYHFSAFAYEKMGKPEKAIQMEAEAMRVSPRDGWTFNFLAVTAAAYIHLGQDEQARVAAERAIQLRPDVAILHALAAAANGNLGLEERARAELAEFRRLQPDYTIAKFRADFPSASAEYIKQREHLYRGLIQAGLSQ
jgi:TolB-like protein/Tfp pilus assembly protein PilF